MDSKQGIHVMTLANSIIGVSILAMPYCFKQCGIILSIILLIISSIISRLTCHFLLKSAIKVRLRTFEFLAYHVFGSVGKLFVEIAMIGFLIGTCIAFFVVMGDLGPQIIAHMTETKSTDAMRTTILIALAAFCVLPLGLLRNVDSLSGVCTATIGFYACLVLKIMGESAPHLLVGDWYNNVEYWRPAGILQCIPIFSMALFCQTQLFEIYQAIPNASLDKMNNLVRIAVNICTCVYIFVGVFGYIAISEETNFSGNILSSFKPSTMTEIMKIGFVLSVAFSFPLVIFPCRASLYSLLYKPTYSSLHETSTIYIPEGKFRILTFVIVSISLIIGVLIPNIELVLGLVGSTIGVMICVLFPATCFICLTSKNTNERILAQIMLFIGIVVMVLGTYANLYAMEHVTHIAITEKSVYLNDMPINANSLNEGNKNLITTMKNIAADASNKVLEINIKLEQTKEIRHEPPQPEAPVEETKPKVVVTEKVVKETSEIKIKSENNNNKNDLPKESDAVQQEVPQQVQEKEVITIKPTPIAELKKNEPIADKSQDTKEIKPKVVETGTGELNIEAIQKEENELRENAKQDDTAKNLEEQKKLVADQKKLLDEQKLVLEELKRRQEQDNKEIQKVQETKLKAVKQIADLAKSAIEKIVDKNNPITDTNNIVSPDPKPLSYQLGLDSKKTNDISNLAPLPIAFAKNLSQARLFENISTTNITENIIIKTKIEEPVPKTGDLKILQIIKESPTVVKSIKLEAEKPNEPKVDPAVNVDNIRRDILSETDYTRRKRDVEDKHCEKNKTLNDPILDVTQEKINIAPLSRDLKSTN